MISRFSLFAGTFLALSALTTGASGLERRQDGEEFCNNVMCISATGNGSAVEYVLRNIGDGEPGWMAMGFGRQMSGTPMVIMWANSDGTITLSQRQARGQTEPQLVEDPPFLATLSNEASSVASGDIRFAYTREADGESTQNIIYAYGGTNPEDSAPDATLQVHLTMGTTSLAISGDVGGSGDSNDSPSDEDEDEDEDDNENSGSSGSLGPLTHEEKVIAAHAILCIIGFLFFLPAGALLARYFRTFSTTWFTGHWISQFTISGPIIIAGVALGISSVDSLPGGEHLNDTHKRFGIAIFVLYFVQCILGAIIHFVKPRQPSRRPPQNYLHGILGVAIIACALYQVRNGYTVEWPKVTGREVANGANIIWYVWVVLLPVLYAVGLAFLPKQYRQEAEARKQKALSNGY